MTSRLLAPRTFIALLALACAAPAFPPRLLAQDTRTVTEPVVPPVCTTLEAQLTSSNEELSPANEGHLDTSRIQHAIDHCGKGKAVALRTKGAANSFLSGPLELREGVTLLVDKGVTLFESVDPKILQISSGSCGLVSKAPGRGCKPLISVNHVAGAAVMGDGIIDGRGNINLVGTNKSSWDLAEDARPGEIGRAHV
jgi:polygalacturonase